MPWYTEYSQSALGRLARLEAEYPYLTALVASRADSVELVRMRLRNYREARQHEISQPEVVPSLPYHVVLDPSTICTLACPLCVQATDPNGRPRRLLQMKDFDHLLDQIDTHTIRLELFSWGEPFLNPNFSKIVAKAGAHSLYTRTSSHFSHSKGIPAERLIEAGLSYIVASIDGATQETYERYRVRGNLAVALKNLEALVAARERLGAKRPLIEWQCLALRHNVEEIEQVRVLARNIGVDVFRYGGARGRMDTKVMLDTPTNFAQSSDILLDPNHPLSEYDERGEKRRTEETKRCQWLWGKVALHPDGGISPCWSSWSQSHDFSSWTRDSLASVWNSPTYQKARYTACHGGNLDGDLICDKCAFHRNFVSSPDGDNEPLPDAQHITKIAQALTELGMPPAPEVVQALEEELQGSLAIDTNIE